MDKKNSFLIKLPIAHRGLFNNKEIYENTISAFKLAIENNYAIELDVHLTKDNKIIVIHDSNLKRLFNVNKKIRKLNYEQIKKIQFPNSKDRIPLLKDVLKLVDGKVPIIIEIKYDRLVGKLEKNLINILSNYQGEVVIKSFRARSINYFRKKCPNILRGQLLMYSKKFFYRLFFNLRIFYSRFSKPDFYSCNMDCLENKKILKLKKDKIILGWVVRDKKNLKYVKMHCDNYIFEEL